jgi:hypothetical protein
MPRSKNRFSSKAHREAKRDKNKSRHHYTKRRKNPIQGLGPLDSGAADTIELIRQRGLMEEEDRKKKLEKKGHEYWDKVRKEGASGIVYSDIKENIHKKVKRIKDSDKGAKQWAESVKEEEDNVQNLKQKQEEEKQKMWLLRSAKEGKRLKKAIGSAEASADIYRQFAEKSERFREKNEKDLAKYVVSKMGGKKRRRRRTKKKRRKRRKSRKKRKRSRRRRRR